MGELSLDERSTNRMMSVFVFKLHYQSQLVSTVPQPPMTKRGLREVRSDSFPSFGGHQCLYHCNGSRRSRKPTTCPPNTGDSSAVPFSLSFHFFSRGWWMDGRRQGRVVFVFRFCHRPFMERTREVSLLSLLVDVSLVPCGPSVRG